MESFLEEQEDPPAATVGAIGASSQAPDSESDDCPEPAAKRGKFSWADHTELAGIVAEQRQERGSLRGGGGVQAGWEDLRRRVELANVQRAAAGEQPICIPDSLTQQAYQTKFSRSAPADGSRKRGRVGASSQQPASQAVPPAPQQQQQQVGGAGGQRHQPAGGARTAANVGSARASVDCGSDSSAQQDGAGFDIDGAKIAVMALIRHMFKVLEKFPFLQLFIAADFPGNKLIMDGG